ncbi:hypothetical protein GIB67_010461 [Kingdonia uniflora]|uniref:Transcription factor GAMYB n=1 Tax=Kingdonia uniflora TaxID=39325 RepID=A0A7J7MAI4_9MAGN|nr:hypothetical protein GIB67_010461 [Kingdonia uniflora]
MSFTTNESEGEMLSKDLADSLSNDEGYFGGSSGSGPGQKKGPWTSAEDAILVDYVKKHGEGNWNSVQKNSGLSRCGKSCRLRWANHLRPNLKKGSFTLEEERQIVELHAKMGNKWARMAARLPGRTDNEIKNYWNTRIKRRQRAGLPLYPPDIPIYAFNESPQTKNTGEYSIRDRSHHDFLHANNYGIPDVKFDNLKGDQGGLSYVFPLLDISAQGSCQNYNFMRPKAHQPKRLRESEMFYSNFNGSLNNRFSPFGKFHNDAEPFNGSHAFVNGNFSTSKPFPEAVKLELPSLQFAETDLGSWDRYPLPQMSSFGSAGDCIQSPFPTGPLQSDCLSARNSGLLEVLLHEAQALKKSKSSEKSPNSSIATPSDLMDSSVLNPCEMTVWEEYGDHVSPLAQSAQSVFSEHTPTREKSVDEHLSDIKLEKVNLLSSPVRETQLDFSRPDALLGACWMDKQISECPKDQSVATDAIATFLGEDFCNDHKHTNGTSSYNEGWGLGSYSWNSMPAAFQMSEHL